MDRNTVAAYFLGFIIVTTIGGYYWFIVGQPSTVQIQQKGSDTLLILAQNWAEAYMSQQSDVEVVVSGGGTGTGFAGLINGQIDVADASRRIRQPEIDAAEERGVDPVEWRVAVEGVSVIVNRANPVEELSYRQLHGLYNGETTSWSEVGGADTPVVAYGRQSTSGTYVYFNEEVLEGDDYRPDMNQMAGNADIVEAVINDPNGVGYVGVAYSYARRDELKIVGVRRHETSEAYQPTGDNIANGNYPISRYLYVYTDGPPEGAIRDYLRYIIGHEGQDIVEDMGYIALPSSVQTEQLDQIG